MAGSDAAAAAGREGALQRPLPMRVAPAQIIAATTTAAGGRNHRRSQPDGVSKNRKSDWLELQS